MESARPTSPLESHGGRSYRDDNVSTEDTKTQNVDVATSARALNDSVDLNYSELLHLIPSIKSPPKQSSMTIDSIQKLRDTAILADVCAFEVARFQ